MNILTKVHLEQSILCCNCIFSNLLHLKDEKIFFLQQHRNDKVTSKLLPNLVCSSGVLTNNDPPSQLLRTYNTLVARLYARILR